MFAQWLASSCLSFPTSYKTVLSINQLHIDKDDLKDIPHSAPDISPTKDGPQTFVTVLTTQMWLCPPGISLAPS